MVWSHSKLNCILQNPMEYFLSYVQGISPKVEKSAFAVGSAVHWCIEHSTEDLTDYITENGSFKDQNNYTESQILVESMAHGYLKHKDEMFEQLLMYNGEKLNLVNEIHELKITAKLKSYAHPETPHEFLGIIDLLLLTDKGFILVDYKTSSRDVNFDDYKDQLYRYIMLLNSEFPDVPVIKIAIINLKKTGIKQKQKECYESYLFRLRQEYEINDNALINYHEFLPEEIDPKLISDYVDNLSKMVDFAENIDNNKLYYINYMNANTLYGKSQFWDIFYKTPDNYALYKIKDTILDDFDGSVKKERNCVPIDMLTMENSNVLNKFDIFKSEVEANKTLSKEEMNKLLNNKYITDNTLIDKYWEALEKVE